MDLCPVCGSKLAVGSKACDICGTAFDAGSFQCPLCGADVEETARQCPSCGSKFEETAPAPAGVPATTLASQEDIGAADEIAKKVFVALELEELVKVPGIGPLRAKILYDAGFTDLRKLKQASVVELMNIKGIGRKAAGEIKAALREHTLEEIRSTELTEETVGSEFQCPLCGTIVSAFETSCYECGCLFKQGQGDSGDSDRLALSYYDSKLLRTPDNKDLWYARGATLVKMGSYDQALSSFNKALEIDKSFQAAWMSKAEVYNKIGEGAKAAECYSHIIVNVSGGLNADEDDDVQRVPEDDDLSLDTPPAEPPGPADALPDLEAPAEEAETVREPLPVPKEPQKAEAASPSIHESARSPAVETQPAPAPAAQEPPQAEQPRVIKPGRTGGTDGIDMDYVREDGAKPNYEAMGTEGLKKELSARAAKVKPYITLAKDIGVDINHAKRLVAKAVSESKQAEYKIAIMLMDEAIEFAENEFRRRIHEDIENLASVIRDLAATGKNVSAATELISMVKSKLEAGDLEGSVSDIKKCLELVESAAA